MADADNEDLQQQLKGYHEQLDQINATLVLDADNEELLLLKANLEELVGLTQQNIQAKDDLEKSIDVGKVGSKCQAPFFSRFNGSTSYHNAVIYSDIELQNDCVLVIFSHPIEIAMVPCPFFLEGRCRFTDDKCKYSHGEHCRIAELKEFVAPSYQGLSEGQKVLAKSTQGQLWEYAQIHMVSANCEEVVVQWSNKQVEHLPVSSILPFEKDAEAEIEFDNTTLEKLNQVEDDFILKIDPCADKLGAWETHTRGIGSKLMAKMGYIFGTGLGKESEGRVEPVPIVSYPRGISLDFCQNAKQTPNPTPDLNKKKIRKETNMFDIGNVQFLLVS